MQGRARGQRGTGRVHAIGRQERHRTAEEPVPRTPALPTGTVTFLFTDVEGSTRSWLQNGEAMSAALARHDALIERLVAEHGGQGVRPRGEGDSRFAVFARASDAVSAACALQLAPDPESSP